MKTNQLVVLTISLMVVLCEGSADAALPFSFNSVANFSSTSNPSGPWSYQSVLIGASPSTATNMVYPDLIGENNWTTTYPTDVYDNIGPNGYMHPGNDTDALLGFIYPLGYTSTVSISVDSRDDEFNPSSDGKLLSMWLNNTQLASQFLPGDYSGDIPWQQSLTMHPGDTFFLRLNRGSNNINYGDSQLESATVTQTAVPEPASLLLALLGLVSLGCLGRLKRK